MKFKRRYKWSVIKGEQPKKQIEQVCKEFIGHEFEIRGKIVARVIDAKVLGEYIEIECETVD